jgi:hypothetical protein
VQNFSRLCELSILMKEDSRAKRFQRKTIPVQKDSSKKIPEQEDSSARRFQRMKDNGTL